MIVKLPASTTIVVIAGLLCWWGLSRRTVREAALVLCVPAVAIAAFIWPQPRQLGVRYLLPVIALGIVAGSPCVRLARQAVGARVALAALLIAQVFWFWESTPRSLAWTAPPFRPGYQVAADSNLDWGQDLYRLRDWTRHHPGTTVVYFGTVDPRHILRDAHVIPETLPSGALPAGWWAISTSWVTDWHAPSLAWLRAYCPVGLVGDSILLYRFHASPDRRLRGSSEPPAVCDENFSHVIGRRHHA